jgi:hypothetical protein
VLTERVHWRAKDLPEYLFVPRVTAMVSPSVGHRFSAVRHHSWLAGPGLEVSLTTNA